ncbi:hypothetical protein [Bartonella sp. DGB2]|uniref:hypothetical protein n=1 Tax=Bartonella sp. DGB2 TaxID=3388426 RepID=UPI00399005F0
MMLATQPRTSRARGIRAGYRSGLEELVAQQLKRLGIDGAYESLKIPYTPPSKLRHYTPDFILPNGIIIETKGRFITADRQKHKYIKSEHSALDIRFVFSNAKTKLSKGSPTTYGKWCEQHGFLYSVRCIPKDWLLEPPCPHRLNALSSIKSSTLTL